MRRNALALSFLILCCWQFNAMAQGFYSKGAIVSISNQTVLSVPDSMVNNGTLINNGDLLVSGVWINTGTYDPGVGQIEFNSNITQTINHNAQTVEKLVISGGGKKEFLADITIASELTLTDGILQSKNGAAIVIDKDVVINGGSDQAHIVGPVKWNGDGDWLFPIGNGTIYLPVIVAGTKDATAAGTLTLFELPAGQTLSKDFSLTSTSTKRYWALTTSGPAIVGNTVTLPVNGEDDLTADIANAVVAGASQPNGPYATVGQSANTGSMSSGTVTSEAGALKLYYAVAAATTDHSIDVYNALSAGDDGKNDFLRIMNIEFFPGNKVLIFNRWGDVVFEMSDYDNAQRVFKGFNSSGAKLPAGTYFYQIDLGDSSPRKTGYLVLK